MELFMSSGPDRGPDNGGRSREEAFRSVGGATLVMLRAPWIRLCPWEGGGSGGGGRSVSMQHTVNQINSEIVTLSTRYKTSRTFHINYLKCIFSRSLTVCSSLSPVGGCALASGLACGSGGPLVAQAVCADCAAICREWTAGPGPVGQAFTCKKDNGPQSLLVNKDIKEPTHSGAEAVIKEKVSLIKIQKPLKKQRWRFSLEDKAVW